MKNITFPIRLMCLWAIFFYCWLHLLELYPYHQQNLRKLDFNLFQSKCCKVWSIAHVKFKLYRHKTFTVTCLDKVLIINLAFKNINSNTTKSIRQKGVSSSDVSHPNRLFQEVNFLGLNQFWNVIPSKPYLTLCW